MHYAHSPYGPIQEAVNEVKNKLPNDLAKRSFLDCIGILGSCLTATQGQSACNLHPTRRLKSAMPVTRPMHGM